MFIKIVQELSAFDGFNDYYGRKVIYLKGFHLLLSLGKPTILLGLTVRHQDPK